MPHQPGRRGRPATARFPDLDLILIESGGDNLAATFSPELADLTIYVIDTAAGQDIPRKRGPGVTRSDLLVVNKTDLAPYVGVDLALLEADTRAARGRAALCDGAAPAGGGGSRGGGVSGNRGRVGPAGVRTCPGQGQYQKPIYLRALLLAFRLGLPRFAVWTRPHGCQIERVPRMLFRSLWPCGQPAATRVFHPAPRRVFGKKANRGWCKGRERSG